MTAMRLTAPVAVPASFVNVGGAEIPAYDLITRRSFVVNAGSATVDVLDLRNPSKPTQFGSLDIVADLVPRAVGGAHSVDARFGIRAVAVEAAGALPDTGASVVFSLAGNEIGGMTTAHDVR